MRYASVCDGIGAVHGAWQPLGWHCEWTAEIDAFPAAVVEQRWGFPNRGDMTRFKEWDDAPIELLVGGTPCQSFSVAGLRKGLHDPRGGLMLTFLEIAQRYRPRWVVWENVPGVLSSNGGRDFGSFLGALGELGYGWAYRVLDAQWFGVAQRRRRVFVVGCLGDERRAAEVLFESESVRRDNPPSRAKGERTSGPIAGCSNGGVANGPGITADDADSLIPIWRGSDTTGSTGDGLARCITTGEAKRQDWETCNFVAFNVHGTLAKKGATETRVHAALRSRSPGQSEASTTTVVAFANRTRNGIKVPEVMKDGVTPALTNPGDGGRSDAVNVVVAFTTEQTPKFSSDRALTITKQSPSGGGQPQCVMASMSVRRLTPRECERLQGFPDDYTAIEYRKKPAADGPRYKALGNSMAVPVMAWIGKRIKLVDEVRS